MSFVFYYTPNGDEISTLRARITATGVALLFAYVVKLIFYKGKLAYSRSCNFCFLQKWWLNLKKQGFDETFINIPSHLFICCVW